jgi:hypothetical protein
MSERFDLRDFLENTGPWHVWVLEYGISHGREMRLAFHRGDFPRHTEAVCRWVDFFHGAMEGGPYRLRLLDEGVAHDRSVRIEDVEGNFVIRCAQVSVHTTRE